MPINNSRALNYLRKQQEEQQKQKQQKKERKNTREYIPNEYGYYTMQQCYIINNMLSKGAIIDADGLWSYTNKDGKATMHHITDMTAYNRSVEAYEMLRSLGLKGCVELLQYDDTIKLIRKIDTAYYLTTITEDGITDEPWDGLKQLIQLIRI